MCSITIPRNICFKYIILNTDHKLIANDNTYIITPSMKESPSWVANRFTTSQEIPLIYGNRKFIAAFASARHLSLSWVSSIQSVIPHPTSWRSILLLSSHRHLGLPIGLLPQVSPPKLLYSYSCPLPHTHYVPRPSHSSRFYLPNVIGWRKQNIKLLFM